MHFKHNLFFFWKKVENDPVRNFVFDMWIINLRFGLAQVKMYVKTCVQIVIDTFSMGDV